jgi:predicted ATP-grasp superfamily ATP-dependent carboligase
MSSKRILLTSISTDPGLSVLRQLIESGYDVIGAEWRTLPLGLRSRYLDAVYQLPEPSDPGFDRRLIEVIESVRPDAFLPLLETKIVASACRQAKRIEGLTAINIPDIDAFAVAFDKRLCSAECKGLGIPCPEAYSPDQAGRILANGRGQAILVVKPSTDVGMAKRVEFVTDAERLWRSISICERDYGSAIIQEFIPGDVTHMRTAVVMFGRSSELIAAFTMQKLRQWPPTGGITTMGISTDEFLLVERLLPFFRKWRWRGPAEIELKLDPRDGHFKVIEINPRFPGYLRFPLTCGVHFGLLAASLSLEERSVVPLKYPSYSVGKKYISPGLFLRSTISEVKSASNKFRRLTQAFAELACLVPIITRMANDPLPLMGRLLLDFRHSAGR